MKHSSDPNYRKLKDQLNPMGRFRAANLWEVFGKGNTPEGQYSTPDVIYAMKAGDVRASHLCNAQPCLQCIKICTSRAWPTCLLTDAWAKQTCQPCRPLSLKDYAAGRRAQLFRSALATSKASACSPDCAAESQPCTCQGLCMMWQTA